MGTQRVLQAARVALVITGVAVAIVVGEATARAAPIERERIAIIDLGPDPANDTARKQIATVVAGAGFSVVAADGIADALAGIAIDADAAQLTSALADAQRAYGAFDCKSTIASGQTAVGIAAARQAGGLAVPELPKAWALILLCADRSNNSDLAMRAAARLRVVGGSPDVPADVLAKYPEVDTIVDRELVPLEITADVPNAAIWIDHVQVGTAPITIQLPVGHHVIAAAAGSRRGWASGSAVRTQTKLEVPTSDHGGARSALARRVASWGGKLPAPSELAAVLTQVKARVAIIRSGDRVELWGRANAEPPHLLGGEDGKGTIGEVDRLLALARDRSKTWKDRAPDPDQPLLVEERSGTGVGMRREGGGDRNPRTKWWVYATLAGTVLAGAIVIYSLDAGTDRQRVELVYP